MARRLPGHREGIRRHQRYGQQTLDLGRTLAPHLTLVRPCQFCGSTDCEWAEGDTQLACTDCGFETREFALTISDEVVEVEVVTSIGLCVVCDGRGCEFCPRV